jgi:ABC-type hemin transport system substrate-binding protein
MGKFGVAIYKPLTHSGLVAIIPDEILAMSHDKKNIRLKTKMNEVLRASQNHAILCL